MESETGKKDIVIFETAEGGVGFLNTLLNKNIFEQILLTLELLHDKDPDGGCLRACYECLLNFYNQLEHEKYDRNTILDFLKKVSRDHIGDCFLYFAKTSFCYCCK